MSRSAKSSKCKRSSKKWFLPFCHVEPVEIRDLKLPKNPPIGDVFFGWGAHASRRIHQADHGTPFCRRVCRTLQPFVAYATKGCNKLGSCALRISVNWPCTRVHSRAGEGAPSTAPKAGATSTPARPPTSAISIRLVGGRVRSPESSRSKSAFLAQQSGNSVAVHDVNLDIKLTAVIANECATEESFHLGDKVVCHLHPSDIVVEEDRATQAAGVFGAAARNGRCGSSHSRCAEIPGAARRCLDCASPPPA